MAKRYYDQAATFDEKAKLPRDIALMMLEVIRCAMLMLSHFIICCGNRDTSF